MHFVLCLIINFTFFKHTKMPRHRAVNPLMDLFE